MDRCSQSPFLLGGTLEHDLNQFAREYPEIVEEIKTNLYVDDNIVVGEKRRLPEKIKVPRSLPSLILPIQTIRLHTFADASKDGTAVALYAVVGQGKIVERGLLVSKSRLSRKQLSTPRLELVAAHMAANLLENVLRALSGFPVSKVVAWSDSTVTLHWIKGNGQYKQFVKNRVDKIRCKDSITRRYVNIKENPAVKDTT